MADAVDALRKIREYELAIREREKSIPDFEKGKYSVLKGRFIDRNGYIVHLSPRDMAERDITGCL